MKGTKLDKLNIKTNDFYVAKDPVKKIKRLRKICK